MRQFMQIEGGPAIGSNADVDALLKKIRSDPRAGNPRVLGINQLRQQQLKNGGYPKFMYHETLDPVQAFSEVEEDLLRTNGFQDTYIRRKYPKVLYRRTSDPRFAPKDDPSDMTQNPEFRRKAVDVHPWTEEKIVRDEATEKALLEAPAARGCSKWMTEFSALPPVSEETPEEAALKTARLEGELAALRAQLQGGGKQKQQ